MAYLVSFLDLLLRSCTFVISYGIHFTFSAFSFIKTGCVGFVLGRVLLIFNG